MVIFAIKVYFLVSHLLHIAVFVNVFSLKDRLY